MPESIIPKSVNLQDLNSDFHCQEKLAKKTRNVKIKYAIWKKCAQVEKKDLNVKETLNAMLATSAIFLMKNVNLKLK